MTDTEQIAQQLGIKPTAKNISRIKEATKLHIQTVPSFTMLPGKTVWEVIDPATGEVNTVEVYDQFRSCCDCKDKRIHCIHTLAVRAKEAREMLSAWEGFKMNDAQTAKNWIQLLGENW